MTFWLTLVAYELVWFAAVMGAGHGYAWPGVVATAFFAVWRLAGSRHRQVELKLIAVALVLGILLESVLVRAGLVRYAAPWPTSSLPAWIMALWAAFALTVVPLLGYLRARPWLAAAFGAIGGPLAYLAAARGWHAALFPKPMWPSLLALATGWAIAMPCLTVLARRWLLSPAGSGA
jgi:hypothetical protein